MAPDTPNAKPSPRLTIVEWGALRMDGREGAAEGQIAPVSAIPSGLRRRLGAFERAVVQAVVGLTRLDEPTHVTLGSRFGNLASTAAILDSLAQREAPSPTQFSHSVLNAACGVANQVRKDRTSHTAVSAGAGTLHGALTEAWLHMTEQPGAAHVVIVADAPVPDIYAPLAPRWDAGMAIGLRFENGAAQSTPPHVSDRLGMNGYAGCLNHLRAGRTEMTLCGAEWAMT